MKTWTRTTTRVRREDELAPAAVRFPSSPENAPAQLLCPRLVRERLTLHSDWLALVLALARLLIHPTNFQQEAFSQSDLGNQEATAASCYPQRRAEEEKVGGGEESTVSQAAFAIEIT